MKEGNLELKMKEESLSNGKGSTEITTNKFKPVYTLLAEYFDSMRCQCACAPSPGPYCNPRLSYK